MMLLAWSFPQVFTEPRMDKDKTSNSGDTDMIWLFVRPEDALPRSLNVCAVKTLMLDARAAALCLIRHTSLVAMN